MGVSTPPSSEPEYEPPPDDTLFDAAEFESSGPDSSEVRRNATRRRLAELVDDLTLPQRAAVEHRGSPLLVVAGAGSGKTRVLTRRIAHILASGDAPPWGVLAITFTN